MSNSGNVAWRYRWGGWGLARIHTDKRKGKVRFWGGGGVGAAKDVERLALCCLYSNILVIASVFVNIFSSLN